MVKDPTAPKLILSIAHSGVISLTTSKLGVVRGSRSGVCHTTGLRSEPTTATSNLKHRAWGHQAVPRVSGAGL